MSVTKHDGVNPAFPATTEEGEEVTIVEKFYDGLELVLKDEDGNEYSSNDDGTIILRGTKPEEAAPAANPGEEPSGQIGGRTEVENGRADTGASVDGNTFVNERKKQ
ncbi:MAG TPA: hypothetical protein VLA89_17585 [Gemmatimonadales bacterium]|nr:hypothetical protein [Gemmatimonadales bacterium]